MRVGVNTGEVVAGDHARGQALVTGDAVNVAARLEQAAPAGGILIGELTYRALRGRAAVEIVAPVEAKGKALPLVAWRLLGLPELVPSTRVPSARLVGRNKELQRLRAMLAGVASGQRADMVLVSGEAGSGKSRLVSEFVAGSQCRALIGACPSYGRGNTYRPLRELIETAVPLATHSASYALVHSAGRCRNDGHEVVAADWSRVGPGDGDRGVHGGGAPGRYAGRR